MTAEPLDIRARTRSAVRRELSDIAMTEFLRHGFDAVTVTDLAHAAGVSRSTFLRHVGSKEDTIRSFLDEEGDAMVAALRARPSDEGPWAALRGCLGPVVDLARREPEKWLAVTRLIQSTPSLMAAGVQKFAAWKNDLAPILQMREGTALTTLQASALASAALECLNIATADWGLAGGERPLDELLDEAFAAF